MTNKLTNQGWYQVLVDDLKKLEYTGIVLTKWNIGNHVIPAGTKMTGKTEAPVYSQMKNNVGQDTHSSIGMSNADEDFVETEVEPL